MIGLPGASPAKVSTLKDERGIPTIAPVIGEITQAVVNISAEADQPVMLNLLFCDPQFRDFWICPENCRISSAPAWGRGVIVGISFAVPIRMARSVMEQIIDYGEVRRGQLDVTIRALDADLAIALGVAARCGAVLVEVEPDSVAEEIGLVTGDVVTAVGGGGGVFAPGWGRCAPAKRLI